MVNSKAGYINKRKISIQKLSMPCRLWHWKCLFKAFEILKFNLKSICNIIRYSLIFFLWNLSYCKLLQCRNRLFYILFFSNIRIPILSYFKWKGKHKIAKI